MNIELFNFFVAGGVFFATVLALTTQRYPGLIMYYAISSIFLGLLTGGLGYERHLEHFYIAAIAVLALKGVVLPILLSTMAKRAGIVPRLKFFLRPASHYFLVMGTLGILFLIFDKTPFFGNLTNGYHAYLAISLFFLGFIMIISHRDILSQIVGFLILENGITLFATTTLGAAPLILEIGLFFVVILATMLMATLTESVQEVYGTSDTAKLSDLIE